ncbi:helix-turn-helix transcriptional regulator [Microbacterium sp. Se63.02b]|uniref:helix-turn-helix domain-containing protein n=2 Tax=unclassified Microbacterium TaxID=2609290 RepID=UPI001604E377|nr:helix-turn-helix transcriptional regulator [Microbacterium sp. Se63.02b]QNA93221.1 helix-turn-helix transcriptional regulator [Microbacterium sp. Se63.02b]
MVIPLPHRQNCTYIGTVIDMSPRDSEPEVSSFARKIADALAAVIEEQNISKRELARRINRSNNYVAMRFRHEAAFTLTDVDAICSALGLNAGSFIAGVSAPSNVTALNVRARRQDRAQDDMLAVASERTGEDETDEGYEG